jgi:hypothetical protein
MPKVALRPIDKFSATVKANLLTVKGGMSDGEIGKIIGTSSNTVGNRRRNPLNLTLGEVFLLCQRKKINIADFVSGELTLKGRD